MRVWHSLSGRTRVVIASSILIIAVFTCFFSLVGIPALDPVEAAEFREQSQTATVICGPFISTADGYTVATSLTIARADTYISKNGASPSSKNETTSAAHGKFGYYKVFLDGTDTATPGSLDITIYEGGYLRVRKTVMILPANVYDSLVGGTDTLNVDLTQIQGTAPTTTSAGKVSVGVTHWKTTAVATHTAGYPVVTVKDGAGTGEVNTDSGKVVEVSTLTGHTAQTANHTAAIADVPTVAEFEARTIVAANYFDPVNDTVALVTAITNTVNASAVSATAAFFQDFFTVDSGEVSGSEVAGSVMLEGPKIGWDRVLTGSTHNIAASAGRRLRQVEAITVVEAGTAQAGAAGSITLAAGANANDEFFTHDMIVIVAGAGIGQSRAIQSYAGGSKVASTVPNWVTNPDVTSEYLILADTEKHVYEIEAGGILAASFAAGAIDAAAVADGAIDTGYTGGVVYIDTNASNTNTVNFVDGVEHNPVSTLAAATTIAAANNIKRFYLVAGSSATLAQAYDNYIFDACHATIALGGQSVNNSVFIGAVITGNDDGSNTTHTQYFDCVISASTLGQFVMTRCYFTSTLTLAQAGSYFTHQCFSGIAGVSTPVLDYGAGLNASSVNVRDYSGGLEVQNMGAGTGSYNMSLEGNGQLVINANCSATSTIAIRGNFTVTDNAGGAVTLSDEARFDVAQVTGGAYALDTDANGRIRIVDGTGAGEIDTASGSVANVTLVDTITTYTGNTLQTGDGFARLGAPVGASISADIAVIDAITDKLDTTWVLDGAVYDFTAAALAAAPGGGGGGDATEAKQDAIITHLLDVKGTGFIKDTHSLPQCLTGGGGATWTNTEKEQFRSVLGLTGDVSETVSKATIPKVLKTVTSGR